MLRLIFILLTSLAAGKVSAVEIDIMHYTLHDLHTGEPVALDDFRGKPTFLLVFEPGCRYCARQSRIFNRMLESCDSFQVIAVGVNGSRRSLLDDLDMLRPRFPAVMADAELSYDLGEIVITPVMMLADAKGNYELHLLGLQDSERILSVLGEVDIDCR